ncbi:hypothetical protein ACFL5Z_06750 [Planctomycetota bacterium]
MPKCVNGSFSVLWHQLPETEAIGVFQRPDFCPQPRLALGVFQDIVLELLQGVRARPELLRFDGRQYLECLFQPGLAGFPRAPLFLEFLQSDARHVWAVCIARLAVISLKINCTYKLMTIGYASQSSLQVNWIEKKTISAVSK